MTNKQTNKNHERLYAITSSMNLSSLSTILSKSISKNITIKWMQQKTTLKTTTKLFHLRDNFLYSGHCRHLKFVCYLVRAHNSGGLFRSNVYNLFCHGFSYCLFYRSVRYSGVFARWEVTVLILNKIFSNSFWNSTCTKLLKFLSFDFGSSFERVI